MREFLPPPQLVLLPASNPAKLTRDSFVQTLRGCVDGDHVKGHFGDVT